MKKTALDLKINDKVFYINQNEDFCSFEVKSIVQKDNKVTVSDKYGVSVDFDIDKTFKSSYFYYDSNYNNSYFTDELEAKKELHQKFSAIIQKMKESLERMQSKFVSLETDIANLTNTK